MSENKEKKLYQRWWVWVFGLILIVLIWCVGSNTIDKARTKDIPNVMGINYEDAETVLDENGFKVTAIETDAGSILANDIYNRSVKKGEVFKVNNNTSPNYSYGTTKDKKITIYYAKDDYTYEKPEENTSSAAETGKAKTTEATSSGSSDWRQFLKDYEAWVDSYVEFMKKYKENPQDTSLISEYGKLLEETAEWAEKSQKYEDELKEMSAEDLSEYMQSVTRILEKMSTIGN